MPNLTRIFAGALIALAVLLGILAWTLSRWPAPHPAVPAMLASFPVVVATRVLPAGKPITVDSLRVQSMPTNPNGAFRSPSLLVGRVPTSDIGTDSPVLEVQLVQLSSGISEQVEQGQRAVSVRVDESNAVGNRLRPGNLVDVFFMLKRDSIPAGDGEIEQTQARLLMSKVRVLAFGNATPGADNPGDANDMVRTAVLAVPVADIDRLILAETSGRLFFALRNTKDDEAVNPAAFVPSPGVLKFAANALSNDTAQDSTRAAAGVALDQLSGSTRNVGVSPTRPITRVVGAVTDGIEVIRGGRVETVVR